ncbi:MAG: rRNA maturation RNase YbeY [Patescibacteria group bacterium]
MSSRKHIVRRLRGDADFFRHKTLEILTALQALGVIRRPATLRVGVFLLPNAELRRLKREFLGQDTPLVDVLSFPAPPGFPRLEAAKFLGEVYLNRDIVRNRRRGTRLLIHGALHLLGFSHGRKSDKIRMQKLEKRLVQNL